MGCRAVGSKNVVSLDSVPAGSLCAARGTRSVRELSRGKDTAEPAWGAVPSAENYREQSREKGTANPAWGAVPSAENYCE